MKLVFGFLLVFKNLFTPIFSHSLSQLSHTNKVGNARPVTSSLRRIFVVTRNCSEKKIVGGALARHQLGGG